MEELASTLRRLIEAERRYSEELRRLAESIGYTTVLAAVIDAVASDSEKHARLYEALARIAVGEHQPKLWEEDLRVIGEVIDRHIETERRMIEEARKLLESIAEARMRLILSAIHEDEVRHHKVLVDIRDKIARARVLTEDEFWDAVWRDSPWHGTPGG